MNGRYETDDLEEPAPAPADREISLGTGAMLGIFFGLVLLCGAFFGFGYSMGHKTPLAATGVAASDQDAGSGLASGQTAAAEGGGTRAATGSGSYAEPTVVVKPSAASEARASSAGTPATGTNAKRAEPATETPAAAAPIVRAEGRPPRVVPSTETASAEAATTTPRATTAPPTATAEAAPAATPGTSAVYVQISAVSHPEDAQLLTTALKRRGYEPSVRHSTQDQLLHVQLGPFATKKDADAMRQRLSADGYNAILK